MDGLLVYAVAELLLSIHISLSNLLVLWVYLRCRHVRTVTNTYIFSLALTDFLAGCLGIPATVFSVLTRAPHSFYACLFVHLILCILCTISTFHMLAIAVDKYITICCKDQLFRRRGRQSRAIFLIATSWIAGTAIAILPLFNVFQFASTSKSFEGECHFTLVVDYRYLVYVIFFSTILAPSAIIVFCYVSIYSRIRSEESQIKCLLRASERERRMNGRRKLIRILLILVSTYAVCWYPLYLINTIDLYLPQFHSTPAITLSAVVLSHVSCALNPLIYAYGMPGFKKALREFFHLTADNNNTCANYSCYMRSGKNRSFSVDPRSMHYLPEPSVSRKISAPTPVIRRSLHGNRAPRSRAARRRTIDVQPQHSILDVHSQPNLLTSSMSSATTNNTNNNNIL